MRTVDSRRADNGNRGAVQNDDRRFLPLIGMDELGECSVGK